MVDDVLLISIVFRASRCSSSEKSSTETIHVALPATDVVQQKPSTDLVKETSKPPLIRSQSARSSQQRCHNNWQYSNNFKALDKQTTLHSR